MGDIAWGVKASRDRGITQYITWESRPHGKEISQSEINAALKCMGDGKPIRGRAVLAFPLGELLGGRINGFIWAWALQGILQAQSIPENMACMATQGLEPLITVHDELSTCALAWSELPEYRRILWRWRND